MTHYPLEQLFAGYSPTYHERVAQSTKIETNLHSFRRMLNHLICAGGEKEQISVSPEKEGQWVNCDINYRVSLPAHPFEIALNTREVGATDFYLPAAYGLARTLGIPLAVREKAYALRLPLATLPKST